VNMAYVVSATWRAKAGKEEAIPDLLEARERAFYETIDDHAGGLA